MQAAACRKFPGTFGAIPQRTFEISSIVLQRTLPFFHVCFKGRLRCNPSLNNFRGRSNSD